MGTYLNGYEHCDAENEGYGDDGKWGRDQVLDAGHAAHKDEDEGAQKFSGEAFQFGQDGVVVC